MADTLLPLPTIQNDTDMFWPPATGAVDSGGAFITSMGTRYSGLAIPAAWTTVGNTNMGFTPQENLCGQVFSTGVGPTGSARFDAFQMRPALLRGGPGAPSFRYPTCQRVWRVQLVWQLQAAAVSDSLSTFMGMVIGNGGGPPNAPGNGFFGLVLSAAGRWQWVSRVTGAGFGYAEQIDFAPADILPHMLDIVIFGATALSDAQLQVFTEGVYSAPVLTRNWGAGSLLPIYQTTAKAGGTSFVFGAYALDAAHAVVLQLASLRCSASDFNPQGFAV